MNQSSKPGTAYISMGAGLVPALFVSIIATLWSALMFAMMGHFGLGLALELEGYQYFIQVALSASPYCLIAFLIHIGAILLFPNHSWKTRAGLYALCGAVIALSYLRVQLQFDGIYFMRLDEWGFQLIVIPGALTALSVYALYGAVLYAAKRIFRMER